MSAKRGPENFGKALAAIDQHLKELRALVDALSSESEEDPDCGQIAVTTSESETGRSLEDWWS